MLAKTIKASVRDTAIYGFGNMAVKLVGFILIPFYTNPHYFSHAEFGTLGLLEITAQILAVILGLSLPQSLFRWYWDKDYTSKQKSIFFTSLAAQVVISLVFCAIFITVSKQLSWLILKTDTYQIEIELLLVSAGLQSINNLISSLQRLQSKVISFTVTNLIKLVIVLGITLYLVIGKGMGIKGIYLAQIIGNIIYIVILLPYIISNTDIKFDFPALKGMLSYGTPLLWAGLFTVILNVIDRYSLGYMSALESVAVYTLAYKVSSTLKLIIADSMKMAIGPMIIKKMNSDGRERFYIKIWLYSSFFLMFCIVALSLFSQEIIDLISSDKFYNEAFFLIPIMTISVFFVNLKEINVYGLVISKRSKITGALVAIASVAGIGLNALLIPWFNTYGAAVASFIAQFIFWYLVYYFSQKYYPLRYEIRKLLIIIFVGVAFSFSSMLMKDINLLPRLGLKLLLILIYPFVFYPFGFYEKEEITALWAFIKKWTKLRNFKINLSSIKNMDDE
jgi:O-antigen/teichoic acid export membrane protein